MSEDTEGLPEGWITAPIGELCELNPKHDIGLSDETEVSFIQMLL